MKLARWLAECRMTQTEFAAWLGVSRLTVSSWINEHKAPSPPLMAAISRATRGKVGPRDFPLQSAAVG